MANRYVQLALLSASLLVQAGGSYGASADAIHQSPQDSSFSARQRSGAVE